MTDGPVHEVLLSFDPLRIELPGPGPFAGTVRIVLPEHHVRLIDLSMGGILPGAHVGGEGRIASWNILDIPEPGMEAADLLNFIAEAEGQFKEMHRLIQEQMDGRFLLGR